MRNPRSPVERSDRQADQATESDARPGPRPDVAGILMQATAGNAAVTRAMEARAAQGVAGAGRPLPHQRAIQAAFGRHDVGHVEAHVGGAAADAAADIGAVAYATGHRVAFASQPNLHTAAHEAAHVVQQGDRTAMKVGRRRTTRPPRRTRMRSPTAWWPGGPPRTCSTSRPG